MINGIRRLIATLSACLILYGYISLTYHSLEKLSLENRLLIPENTLIAHALGSYDNVKYSNSFEALYNSHKRGMKYFEVDLSLTGDGDLVCFHPEHESFLGLQQDVGQHTTDRFLDVPYLGDLTIITFRTFLQVIRDFGDSYIITDSKQITSEILRAIAEDVEAVDRTLYGRIFIQFYAVNDLDRIRKFELNHALFGSHIFTLYQTQLGDEELIDFVKRKRVPIVTMPIRRFSQELADRLRNMNVSVCVHTINDVEEISNVLKQGADGIYTDDYFPEDEALLDHD